MPEGKYLTIDEAAEAYGHTRSWWFQQIADGKIKSYDRPGDRKTYLNSTEVEAFLQFKPKAQPGETQAS